MELFPDKDLFSDIHRKQANFRTGGLFRFLENQSVAAAKSHALPRVAQSHLVIITSHTPALHHKKT